MKFHVDDAVISLSGDSAHQLGVVVAVAPVAHRREPIRWLYKVRFRKRTHWLSEQALRRPFKHEDQDG